MVEASTETFSIGTHIVGIVAKIYVQIGGTVKTGDPLFMIDDRATLADIETRRATVHVAETRYRRPTRHARERHRQRLCGLRSFTRRHRA